MSVYLEWLYTRLRAKLAVCIASAKTEWPTAVFCAVAQLLVFFTLLGGRVYRRIELISTATFVTFRSTVHHYDAVDVLCLIANSCAAAVDASLRT